MTPDEREVLLRIAHGVPVTSDLRAALATCIMKGLVMKSYALTPQGRKEIDNPLGMVTE